jgi:hypothetical protein
VKPGRGFDEGGFFKEAREDGQDEKLVNITYIIGR